MTRWGNGLNNNKTGGGACSGPGGTGGRRNRPTPNTNPTQHTHLVHLPPEYHEIRIEEFQVLVAIMDPDGVARAAVHGDPRQSPTTYEGMTAIDHRIDHGVHHPAVQSHLDDVVQYHGFGEQ
jgi:hypothetical protein